jgi:hypothetical protein
MVEAPKMGADGRSFVSVNGGTIRRQELVLNKSDMCQMHQLAQCSTLCYQLNDDQMYEARRCNI